MAETCDNCQITVDPQGAEGFCTLTHSLELCDTHARAADYQRALQRIAETWHSPVCDMDMSPKCSCHVSIATEVLPKEK